MGFALTRYGLLAGAAWAALGCADQVLAQEEPAAEQQSIPADWAGQSDALADIPMPPPPPEDAVLPSIPPIIEMDEFRDAIPDLGAVNDPELDRPLESIAEFERRMSVEAGEDDAEALADIDPGAEIALPPLDAEAGAEVPLGDPALADGDAAEEIGDAPIRDAELAAPLPPLGEFQVEPVEFADAEDGSDVLEVDYDVAVNGLEEADEATEADLRGTFADLSALENDDGDAANIAQIAARLAEDSVLIKRLLAAEGWFSAEVETRVDRSDAADGQPLTAVLDVMPGQRYEFAEINIDAPPVVPEGLIEDNLPLEVGNPIIAERVQAAEANVAVTLPQQGYPFAQVGQRDILLDPETGEGVYTLPVDPGVRARFGGFSTSGDMAFGAEHLRTLARFERGELYDSRMVDDLRQALVATGLFNTVSVTPERTGETAEDGTELVTIAVEQNAGPARTLAAGAGYGTGQGVRLEASWTHRNLFPPEGALIVNGVAGTQEQGAGVIFRRSNAGRRDRTFSAAVEALHTNYEAYEAFTARLATRVAYDSTPIWQKPFTYAYGAQLLATNEDDFNPLTGVRERRTFFIGGLQGQVGFDTTESLLNPVEGFRVTALVEPEGSLQGGFTPYVRARLDASAYYPVGDSFVIAGRVALGTIQGIDRFDLAPSRRFYGGGGGSVRGFGYQNLGPKSLEPNPDFDPDDPENEEDPFITRPIGGRSLNEAAIEVRYRFGDFGIVGFVDAGQVYESTTPDFSNLRFGAGIGGRFYTNFGPLRLDIATPLDRQEGESAIAVYVSIGQAF